MALQFDDILAGKAGGRGEIEHEAAVDGALLCVVKIGVEGQTRLRGFAAADLLRHGQQVFAGNADNAHAAAPRGGGDGGDGLGAGGHGGLSVRVAGLVCAGMF